MSRGIAFSKNKQVKCFSYCSLSLILISLSVISSCVGANREENWGHRANICYQGSPQTGKEGEASIRAKSRSQISPKKKILLRSLCSRMYRRKKQHKEKEWRQQPTQEGDQASTSTPLLPSCSAGNYNNMFPRQLFSDLFSEHLAFLKSPPDSI